MDNLNSIFDLKGLNMVSTTISSSLYIKWHSNNMSGKENYISDTYFLYRHNTLSDNFCHK